MNRADTPRAWGTQSGLNCGCVQEFPKAIGPQKNRGRRNRNQTHAPDFFAQEASPRAIRDQPLRPTSVRAPVNFRGLDRIFTRIRIRPVGFTRVHPRDPRNPAAGPREKSSKAILPPRGAKITRPTGGKFPRASRRLDRLIRPPIFCAFLRPISLWFGDGSTAGGATERRNWRPPTLRSLGGLLFKFRGSTLRP